MTMQGKNPKRKLGKFFEKIGFENRENVLTWHFQKSNSN